MKTKSSGLLILHLSVLFFGLSSVIARSITWHAALIAWGRVTLSSLFLFFVLRKQKIPTEISEGKDRLLFLLAGVLLAVHWTTFTLSVKEGSVAIATVTYAAFPMFTAFLEPLLFKEKYRLRDFLYAAVMLIGVILLAQPSGFSAGRITGVVFGMIASLTFALLSLINRELRIRHPGEKVAFGEQRVAIVVLLPSVFLFPVSFDARNLALIILLGMMCTAIAYSLFINALESVRVQTAGLVTGLETVYAILFAMFFLGENPAPAEIIGGVIVLGVAVISTLQADREHIEQI